RRLSAGRAAEHRGGPAARHGLRLARADRRRDAGAQGRARRPHLRRAHVRPDRPHHGRHDRDRLPLYRGRPLDHPADRESDGCALGTVAQMSPQTASFQLRSINGLAWRLLPALPFALVLLVWMLGWAVFHPNKATLPPVGDVIEVVWARLRDGELPSQIAASLTRLCLGAGVGILTGVIGGFIAGLYRNVAEFLNPLVVFFNAISGIVWLPLMIGWLGIGTALAVFVIWNTVFFIVFQNTVLGVQLVPEVLEQ